VQCAFIKRSVIKARFSFALDPTHTHTFPHSLSLSPLSHSPHLARPHSLSPPQVRVRVWRALRYVYSVERNRKVFKRLFPPDLFAAFIDIGHYASDLEHYQVSEWSCRNAQLMAQGRGLSTSRYTIWSCGLFEGKGVSTSRVSPTRSSLNVVWSCGLFEGKGVSTSRVSPTRSSLNSIWSCGLFEAKGVSTSRVSPPGPLTDGVQRKPVSRLSGIPKACGHAR
jgi:hypothetical protein